MLAICAACLMSKYLAGARVKSRRERDQLATSGAALVADINLTASDFCYGSVAEVRVSATDMVDLWLMSKKRDSE